MDTKLECNNSNSTAVEINPAYEGKKILKLRFSRSKMHEKIKGKYPDLPERRVEEIVDRLARVLDHDPGNEELTSDDQLNILLLTITGPAAIGLTAYHFNDESSANRTTTMTLLLALSTAAIVVAFVACLTSLRFRRRSEKASQILVKVGSAAAASGYILLVSLFLPIELIWIPLLGVAISVVALSII